MSTPDPLLVALDRLLYLRREAKKKTNYHDGLQLDCDTALESARDRIYADQAANAALAARCEWQPISTAPRNRKIIVGYTNRLGNWRTVMGQFYAADTLVANDDYDDAYAPEGWYEKCESNPDGYIYQTEESPTHWLPLPATPDALAS